MRTAVRWLTTAGSALAAWGLQLLGGWDAALAMLFLLMGLDIAAGLLLGAKGQSTQTPGGGLRSRTLFAGLTRKLMMLLLVALAAAVDSTLTGSGVSRLAVISFYAANEALSIVENAALLGVPFPKGVLKALEAMRDKEE